MAKHREKEVFVNPLREAARMAAQDLGVLFRAAQAGERPLPMPPLREASRQARESLAPLLKAAG